MSDINFSNPANEVVAARVNDTTGVPTEYAVKATGKVVSGKIIVEKKSVRSFRKVQENQTYKLQSC